MTSPNQHNMKTAQPADFKVGTTLINKKEGWKATITSQYSHGVWEANMNPGKKCIFECEASLYLLDSDL